VRAFLLGGGLAAALGVALPASARKTYPGVVQDQLRGGCAPQCTLCHTRPEGGSDSDPYLKPSELTPGYVPPMLPGNRGQGAFFANLVHVNGHRAPLADSELANALRTLASANCSATASGPCDSDGDGVPDTVELGMDRNPDVPNDKDGDLCVGPKYGCGAHIGALPNDASSTRDAALVSLLGFGLVLLRRARRR